MVNPRKNETSPASGTESTPARSVCRKKLTARNGTRPCWIRSNVSSNVLTMNQNTPPTSRRKVRVIWPIPWATKTGGLASAMARNVTLVIDREKSKVCDRREREGAETLRHYGGGSVTFGFHETRGSSRSQLLLCIH